MDETQKLLRALLENFQQTNAALAALTSRFDTLIVRIDTMEQRLDDKIDSLERRLNDRIDALEQRLDDRIDALEQRLDGRIDALEASLAEVKENMVTKAEFSELKAVMATKTDIALVLETCATKEEVYALDKRFQEAEKRQLLKNAMQDQEIMIIKQKLAL
ncbi:hypothetical protein CIG75_03555 [Tumebacillus algifaecis]|uniref:t-SNARE coiled-coil homology domain-containing protein n=1 Tax=Tumebacillus algifaecis TaxID=1214604 RepID=A0A223CY38_9BACL|nr:hypothetical protein [Tumebacillus algifaecis]ASS74155.1 hypothetical protein CIG75_03555 [Tumebacillus algifaecis]